jgi:hypothetical protein
MINRENFLVILRNIFSPWKVTDKKNPILPFILIGALAIDMLISSFLDVNGGKAVFSSAWGIGLFVVVIGSIFISAQYLLLGFVKKVSKEIRTKKSDMNAIYTMVTICQYVISGILVSIILQIIFLAQFFSILIILATLTSYIPASLIMCILSYRFYSSYKSSKNNISLLFFLGVAMVAINVGVGAIIHSYYIWTEKPNVIQASKNFKNTGSDYDSNSKYNYNFPKITPRAVGSTISLIYLYGFFIPLNLAYLFAWGGCLVLLCQYKILGGDKNIKFWIIVSIPLIIFLIANYPLLISGISNSSFTFYDKDLILFRTLFRIAGIAGGIFIFCVALLTISRNIRSQSVMVSDYMSISAYGVAMLAISVQSPIIHTPYPPFGIGASSFMALASYLFGLGFYFSAISISQNTKLRQSIKKYAVEKSKLLDSIGTSEMEQEIESKVLNLAKEQREVLAEQTGVQPSLTDIEIKEYLEEVLSEVKLSKKK